ncbi:MAG TPA: glycosyltransferase family 87 protein, partial [Planctomycetota bacterium]|nr:glycosyltransferase family 87 protein [Planctomycetota bacterium]
MSIPPSSPPERCQDEAAGAGAGARAVVPDRLAWCLWGAFALLIAAVKFADPPVLGDVFTIYHDAACRWLAGQPLYNGEGTEFIYLPQSAVLWTPFALLPYAIGGALLRVLNVAAFAIGVRGLARLGSDELAGVRFLCVSVPAILMSWSSARAGQMTLAMGGMMMLALAALAAQRWWRAALWLTVGLALKPLIVVLTLLVVALARPTRWPLLVATLLLLALPFLAQAS